MSSAFFTIGVAYECLGEIDFSMRCFREAFGASPSMNTDYIARANAGVFLANYLLLRGTDGELDAVGLELLAAVESTEVPDTLRAILIFGKIEDSLRKNLISKVAFHKLLEKLEQGTEKLSFNRRLWWLAEIYKRKAGIDSLTQEADYYPSHLRKSWEYAREGDNFQILTEVGNHLSFRFCGQAGSIKELAEIQLSVLFGICHDQGSIERLRILGDHLVRFWSQVSYRRIAVSDLPYLANLRDRAKSFSKKLFTESLWSPLMVLLLLKVTGRNNDERYKAALNWATEQLKDSWDKIPDEEITYINE